MAVLTWLLLSTMTYLVINETEAQIDLGQQIHNLILGTTNKQLKENPIYNTYLNTTTQVNLSYLFASARNENSVNRKIPKELPDPNSTNVTNHTKRSEAPAEWKCESLVRWKDLGSLHYPRFVKEVVCFAETSACFNGFYSCRPSFYPVSVLTATEITRQQTDMTLPFPLRQHWQFVTINVSVGCLCGH